MIVSELLTLHDSHKSFHRKAFVIYHDADISLVSYDIVICTIKPNGKLVMEYDEKDLSATTKRHLKEFRGQLSHRINDGI